MDNSCIDAEEIRNAIAILKPNNQLFEVRIIRGISVFSGYFTEADVLIDQLSKQDLTGCNVYMTVQEVHEGCAARIQWNHFEDTGKKKLPTTSDNCVTRYRFIPIDLDPVRPAGISSTREELENANEVRKMVMEYMTAQGFKSGIAAFSGNGYHLLYPVDLPNTKESEEIIKGYLQRLDELFSNGACHVDTTNSNPSRVLKLYGTLAQKGRNTEDRPHRMSKIMKVFNEQN